MKKALIIGSSSLVGQALLAELEARSARYRTLDRSGEFNLFDEYDDYYWDEMIAEFHEVVYISWIGSPSTAQDAIKEGVDVNLRTLKSLCAALARRGSGHLVFLSSAGAIYGGGEYEVSELSDVSPVAYYGESKLKAEQMIVTSLSGQDALRFSLLRISNIVGLRRNLTSGFDLVNHLVTCIKNGEAFSLYGDGENTRDFIAVADVASAIGLVLVRDGDSEVFNICAGQSYSINEVIALVEEVAGKTLQVNKLEKRCVDIRHIRVSAGKAKELLLWRPQISLAESIAHILHAN